MYYVRPAADNTNVLDTDGTEQVAYTGQSKYINTQTRRNGFIPQGGFVLKDPSDRVAENRANLTAGIILRGKGFYF